MMIARILANFTGMSMLLGEVPPAAANDPPPASPWNIERSTVALSGAVRIAATLPSTEPLQNQIGQPERAALILRCSEGVMAAYVAWPQVLSLNGTTFGGRQQTMVLFRVDEAPIRYDFWLRADNGTAAGGFDNRRASHIVGMIINAHRLVVRMTGTETQDAVFDLGDIARVASEVGGACNVRWEAPR